MPEIITGSEAKARGLTRFFTGEPCIHGHLDERLVSNSSCMECARIRQRAWTKNNLSKCAAYLRGRYQENPEKILEYNRKSRAKNRGKAVEKVKRWRIENPEKLKEQRQKRLLVEKKKRITDQTWKAKRQATNKRIYLEGPSNPKGELQWLNKAKALLRTTRRTLKSPPLEARR